MAISRYLIDVLTRHQVLLERLKAGEVESIDSLLSRLDAAVRAKLAAANQPMESMTTSELEAVIRQVLDDKEQLGAAWKARFEASLRDLADHEAATSAKALDETVVSGGTVMPISAQAAWEYARRAPIQSAGKLLEPFIREWTDKALGAVEALLRRAHDQGWTNDQTVRALKGTKAKGFKDGIVPGMRKSLEALTRTAMQHVSNAARAATIEANADIVTGYMWVATLDRATCLTCASLDGEEFPIGKGPRPPHHPNCRCTIVAMFDDSVQLLAGGKRASKGAEGGAQVAANLTYFGWLKQQPAAFQNLVLGQARAKLLRDGGLTAQEFARLNLGRNFKPLSLAEMKAKAPQVFDKAGVGPEGVPSVAKADVAEHRVTGVAKADLGTGDVADRVIAGLAAARAWGIALPQVVRARADGPAAELRFVGAVSVLFVNPLAPYWKADGEPGWTASAGPHHAILHELAHLAHRRAVGEEAFAAVAARRFDAAEQKAALAVGRIAATEPAQFVAEVFAGRCAGRSYGGPVLELYAKLGGPVLDDWSEVPRDEHGRWVLSGGPKEVAVKIAHLLGPGTPEREWPRADHLNGRLLTDPQAEALRRYVFTAYEPINDRLRGSWVTEKDESKAEAYTRELDAAFSTVEPLSEKPLVVWRGAEARFVGDLHEGDVLEDPGFVSTSFDPAVAADFSDRAARPAMCRILLPAGTRALNVRTAEAEVLLQRGARFRVTRRVDVADGSGQASLVGVDLEYLGPAAAAQTHHDAVAPRSPRSRFVWKLGDARVSRADSGTSEGARKAWLSRERRVAGLEQQPRLRDFLERLAERAGIDAQVRVEFRKGVAPEVVGKTVTLPTEIRLEPVLLARSFLHELQHAADTKAQVGGTQDEVERRARFAETLVDEGAVRSIWREAWGEHPLAKRADSGTTEGAIKAWESRPHAQQQPTAGDVPELQRDVAGMRESLDYIASNLMSGPRAHPDYFLDHSRPEGGLSEHAFKALDDYLGVGYRRTNVFLRHGPDELARRQARLDPSAVPKVLERARESTAGLDEAFASVGPTDNDFMVLRGTTAELVSMLQVGDVVEDKGFVSTTFDRATAIGFGVGAKLLDNPGDKGGICVIRVPKGTRALFAMGAGEEEMILQRGARFRVTRLMERNGSRGVELEYLGSFPTKLDSADDRRDRAASSDERFTWLPGDVVLHRAQADSGTSAGAARAWESRPHAPPPDLSTGWAELRAVGVVSTAYRCTDRHGPYAGQVFKGAASTFHDTFLTALPAGWDEYHWESGYLMKDGSFWTHEQVDWAIAHRGGLEQELHGDTRGETRSYAVTTTSQCSGCEHFHRHVTDGIACNAFPDGIPADVVLNRVSHADAIEGDHGVRFSPRPELVAIHTEAVRAPAELHQVHLDGGGTYIGLKVPAAAASFLAGLVPGGEAAADSHITLFWAKGLTADQAATVERRIAELWAEQGPIMIEVDGVGFFPATPSSDGKDVMWARPLSMDLLRLRQALVDRLAQDGIRSNSAHESYVPHLTLKYLDPGEKPTVAFDPLRIELTDYVFDPGEPTEREDADRSEAARKAWESRRRGAPQPPPAPHDVVLPVPKDAPAAWKQVASMTEQEFAANPPPGFEYAPHAGWVGQRAQGVTRLSPLFFRSKDPGSRIDLLAHEQGHDLMAKGAVVVEGGTSAFDDFRDVLEPFRENKGTVPLGVTSTWENPFGLSTRPEEIIADVYSEIWSDSARAKPYGWEPGGKYANLIDRVREVAKRKGLPLPSERHADSGTHEGALLAWEHREHGPETGDRNIARLLSMQGALGPAMAPEAWPQVDHARGRLLPEQERSAVIGYAALGYENVNRLLRGQDLVVDAPEGWDPEAQDYAEGKAKAAARNLAGRLDRAFDAAVPLSTQPLVVWRGISASLAEKVAAGDTLDDKGFVSTSFDPEVAAGFSFIAGEPRGAILRIDVPAGAVALNVPGGEAELILRRGAKFRVLRKIDVGGQLGIGLEYLGSGAEARTDGADTVLRAGDFPVPTDAKFAWADGDVTVTRAGLRVDGTAEGAKKAWDTRGRARKVEAPEVVAAKVKTFDPFVISHHEDHPYSQSGFLSSAVKWLKGLPSAERDALLKFKGIYGKEVNKHLRHGTKGVDPALAGRIEAAIDAAPPLKNDTIVWRGLRGVVDDPLKYLRQHGNIISDKGFASTSLDPNVARRFSDGTLVRVTLPKGTRAAPMAIPKGMIGGGLAPEEVNREVELLVQRGSRFKVTRVTNVADGHVILDAEYLGSKAGHADSADKFTWSAGDVEFSHEDEHDLVWDLADVEFSSDGDEVEEVHLDKGWEEVERDEHGHWKLGGGHKLPTAVEDFLNAEGVKTVADVKALSPGKKAALSKLIAAAKLNPLAKYPSAQQAWIEKHAAKYGFPVEKFDPAKLTTAQKAEFTVAGKGEAWKAEWATFTQAQKDWVDKSGIVFTSVADLTPGQKAHFTKLGAVKDPEPPPPPEKTAAQKYLEHIGKPDGTGLSPGQKAHLTKLSKAFGETLGSGAPAGKETPEEELPKGAIQVEHHAGGIKSLLAKLTGENPDAYHQNASRKTAALAWEKALAAVEHDAIQRYQGAGYGLINGWLRKGKGYDSEQQAVSRIESAIDKAPPIDKDTVVWRGFGYPKLKTDPAKILSLNGNVYYDKGFISTSVDPSVAHGFESGVLVRITLPKGTRAAYLGHFNNGHFESEREYLLQRGAKFRVKRIIKGESVTLLDVEYLGSKKEMKWKEDGLHLDAADGLRAERFCWLEDDGEFTSDESVDESPSESAGKGPGSDGDARVEGEEETTREDAGTAEGALKAWEHRPRAELLPVHHTEHWRPAAFAGELGAEDHVRWLAEHSAAAMAWRDALPAADRNALTTYQGLAYRAMNAALRGRQPRPDGIGDSWEADLIRGMDRVIDAAPPLDRDAFVWRGIRNMPELSKDPAGYLASNGNVFTDRAFVSTSLDAQTAEEFSGADLPRIQHAVVVQIKLPKGTKAAPLLDMDEAEYILGRDASFKVTAIHRLANGTPVIQAEYLGSSPAGLTKRGWYEDAAGADAGSRFAWGPGDLSFRHERADAGTSGGAKKAWETREGGAPRPQLRVVKPPEHAASWEVDRDELSFGIVYEKESDPGLTQSEAALRALEHLTEDPVYYSRVLSEHPPKGQSAEFYRQRVANPWLNPLAIKVRADGAVELLIDGEWVRLDDTAATIRAWETRRGGVPADDNRLRVRRVARAKARAWAGKPTKVEADLTKPETGLIGEQIALQLLRAKGIRAKPVHILSAAVNTPVDLVARSHVYEVKAGVASSTTPKWRTTIGEPGDEEKAWLAKASPRAKAAWNRTKVERALERKGEVLRDLSKKAGRTITGRTIGIILNPDTKTADVHVFDGFHKSVGWNSELAKSSYVGSYRYA